VLGILARLVICYVSKVSLNLENDLFPLHPLSLSPLLFLFKVYLFTKETATAVFKRLELLLRFVERASPFIPSSANR